MTYAMNDLSRKAHGRVTMPGSDWNPRGMAFSQILRRQVTRHTWALEFKRLQFRKPALRGDLRRRHRAVAWHSG